MAWLSALIKGILEWLSAEVKKDTKAGDADDVSQDLKDRWRSRIKEQEEKKEDEKYLTDTQREALDKSNKEPDNS